MTRQLLATLFILIFFCATGLAQEKWDLKKAVDYAVANNISVKQADLQARLSKLTLSQYELSRYPTANFQGNVGYRFGLSENPTTGVLENKRFLSSGYQLSSNVSLFNWFSKKYDIEAARLSNEADRAQIKKVQDDIAWNVAVAYLQALMSREQANITNIQVQQTSA